MPAGSTLRLAAAAVGVAALVASASSAEVAHRRHRQRAAGPVAAEPAAPPPLQDRAAYRSGYAFGLFDLGISGTPSALSPYVGHGAGNVERRYVRPGYDDPGFGYPGY